MKIATTAKLRIQIVVAVSYVNFEFPNWPGNADDPINFFAEVIPSISAEVAGSPKFGIQPNRLQGKFDGSLDNRAIEDSTTCHVSHISAVEIEADFADETVALFLRFHWYVG